MEHIEFRTIEEQLGVGLRATLIPYLNGVPLPNLVHKTELPFSRRERRLDRWNRYAGLVNDHGPGVVAA